MNHQNNNQNLQTLQKKKFKVLHTPYPTNKLNQILDYQNKQKFIPKPKNILRLQEFKENKQQNNCTHQYQLRKGILKKRQPNSRRNQFSENKLQQSRKVINLNFKRKVYSKSMPIKFHHIKRPFQIKSKAISCFQKNSDSKTQNTILNSINQTQNKINKRQSLKLSVLNENTMVLTKKLQSLHFIRNNCDRVNSLYLKNNSNVNKLKLSQKVQKIQCESDVGLNRQNATALVAKQQTIQPLDQISNKFLSKQIQSYLFSKNSNITSESQSFSIKKGSSKLDSLLSIKKCQIEKHRCSIFQNIYLQKIQRQKFVISDSLFKNQEAVSFIVDLIAQKYEQLQEDETLSAFFMNQTKIKQIYSQRDGTQNQSENSQVQNMLAVLLILNLTNKMGVNIKKEACATKEIIKRTDAIPFSIINCEYISVYDMICLLIFTDDISIKKLAFHQALRILEKFNRQMAFLQNCYNFDTFSEEDEQNLWKNIIKKYAQQIGLKSTKYQKQNKSLQKQACFIKNYRLVSTFLDASLLMIKAMSQPYARGIIFKRTHKIKISNLLTKSSREINIQNKNPCFGKPEIASLYFLNKRQQLQSHIFSYQIKTGIYLIVSHGNYSGSNQRQKFFLQILQWILVQMNIQQQFNWNMALQILAKISTLQNYFDPIFN